MSPKYVRKTANMRRNARNPKMLRDVSKKSSKMLTKICEVAEIGAVQKNAHLVDLETYWKKWIPTCKYQRLYNKERARSRNVEYQLHLHFLGWAQASLTERSRSEYRRAQSRRLLFGFGWSAEAHLDPAHALSVTCAAPGSPRHKRPAARTVLSTSLYHR